jgi:hypothetical protein
MSERFKVGNNLKHITVSEKNYQALKALGRAGDSFNDVVTEVLKKFGSVLELQFDSEVGAYPQAATTTIASKRSITKGVQSNYA